MFKATRAVILRHPPSGLEIGIVVPAGQRLEALAACTQVRIAARRARVPLSECSITVGRRRG